MSSRRRRRPGPRPVPLLVINGLAMPWPPPPACATGSPMGTGSPSPTGWAAWSTWWCSPRSTNSKNTPVEALERAFPMRVLRYTLRRGSGGAGRAPGGEGIERDLLMLENTTLSLITERRVSRPWGLAGGEPGAGRELVAAGRRRITRGALARQMHDPAHARRRSADADTRGRRLGCAPTVIASGSVIGPAYSDGGGSVSPDQRAI